jgi:hypothetical protein
MIPIVIPPMIATIGIERKKTKGRASKICMPKLLSRARRRRGAARPSWFRLFRPWRSEPGFRKISIDARK